MITRRTLRKYSDSKLDKTVKIAGTNYDRRRKVTKSMKVRMNQMVKAGKSYAAIARHFGVSAYAVHTNTDSVFKTAENNRLRELARMRPETKKSVNTVKTNNFTGRVTYKRQLVEEVKKLSTIL